MATRTVEIHDRCTTTDCNRILHSISEGERGLCSSCWMQLMKPDTRQALNKLIASAFNASTNEERNAVVDDAMGRLKRDGVL